MATHRLKDAGNTVLNRFSALDPTKKVLVGTIVLAMALSSVFLFQKTTDDYDVLYSNLDVTDASATVAKLKELNEPFKLADGGSTVLVQRARKNEMVLETAPELSSNQTVSLGKIPPVLQGAVQKEWLKQFNSDSIGNTLTAIQGIRDAKVMIAQPEESVFSSNKDPVRASVMLVVEPGFRLKESQIKTIKHLVAHSVPGLETKHVAISDNFGNSLEDASQSGVVTSDAEAKRKQFEEELHTKVMNLVEPLVGKDNAVVSVSADMNFDQARARIHSIVPVVKEGEGEAKGLVVSQQNQQEEYTGLKGQEGGAPGAETNAAASYPTSRNEADDKDKLYRSSRNTVNYAHSEEDKEVIYATGTVQRVSVAVILNKVLTSQETQELKEAIASAAGLDLQRGDTVDVKGFQFSELPSERNEKQSKAFQEAQFQEFLLEIGYLVSIIVLGLTALLVFYNLMKRPPAQAEAYDADDYGGSDGGAYAGGLLPGGGVAGHLGDGSQGSNLQALLAQQQNSQGAYELPKLDQAIRPEVEEMREIIFESIKADPEQSAKLIISFMKDDL